MLSAPSAAAVAVDVVLTPLPAGTRHLPAGLAAVDAALEGELSVRLGGEFRGRLGEVNLVTSLGNVKAKRVGLLGLGDPGRLDRTRVLNALQIGFRSLPGGTTSVAIVSPGGALAFPADELACAVVEAAVLAGFSEGTHKTTADGRSGIASVSLVGFPRVAQEPLDRAALLAEATNLARELVNLPASELDPPDLARRARSVARAAGLSVEVLGRAELRRRKYGALLAVASGSVHPPQLVVLRYTPSGRGPRPAIRLALVGKGITFDSGGIDVKPAEGMQYMKGDLGGAAAVLGAMKVIAELKPNLEVIGILASAENMISGTAMRPGDVIRTGSGRTVEVVNTDAEGRLVLADGIHHAVTLGATHIVDVATLTGAQRIALGPVAASVVASDDELYAELEAAAADAGERVWRMPAYAEYDGLLRSSIADINNAPGRDGGLITSALIVREFTKGLPWVHIDMAAPSWNRVSGISEIPKGPSGYGVRTLALLAERLAERPAQTRLRVGQKPKSDKISRNSTRSR